MSKQHHEEALSTLIEAFARHAPQRLAQLLQAAEDADAVRVLENLPAEQAAAVVAAMPPESGGRVLALLSPAHAAASCERVAQPLLANLLRAIEPSRQNEILEGLSERTRKQVSRMLAHTPDRVGAHLDPHVLSFHAETPVGDVLATLAKESKIEGDRLFVLDGTQKLVGLVPFGALLKAATTNTVSSLMVRKPQRVAADAYLEDVATHPAWLRVRVLPVVDPEGRLMGALQYETVLRARGELEPQEGPDPRRTAQELAGLYSVGLSALWQWATWAEPKDRGQS